MTIDLMRPAFRPARRKVESATVVIACEAGITLLIISLVIAITIQFVGVRRTTAQIEREVAPLRPRWSVVQTQDREVRRLRREVESIRRLLAAPPWVDVLETLRESIPPGVWFSKIVVDESGVIEVVARTPEDSTIAEFIRRLQANGVQEVRLSATETVRIGGQQLIQATITARVPAP